MYASILIVSLDTTFNFREEEILQVRVAKTIAKTITNAKKKTFAKSHEKTVMNKNNGHEKTVTNNGHE